MAISKKRSEEIKKFKNKDFSDCPKLTNAQLKQMKPCHLLDRDLWKPQKKVMSIRIDVDVLENLKKNGKGWQTKLNSFLRTAVSKGLIPNPPPTRRRRRTGRTQPRTREKPPDNPPPHPPRPNRKEARRSEKPEEPRTRENTADKPEQPQKERNPNRPPKPRTQKHDTLSRSQTTHPPGLHGPRPRTTSSRKRSRSIGQSHVRSRFRTGAGGSRSPYDFPVLGLRRVIGSLHPRSGRREHYAPAGRRSNRETVSPRTTRAHRPIRPVRGDSPTRRPVRAGAPRPGCAGPCGPVPRRPPAAAPGRSGRPRRSP